MTVDQALVLITAHLADVILHWSATAAHGVSPEPVHQMRVAVRRLRTALALFARELPATDFDGVQAGLKQAARHLGVARDWDVFLGDTAAPVQIAFPDDRRIAGLVTAASRQRAAGYAALGAYLASADWMQLSVRLALLPTLRPWAGRIMDAEQSETLAAPAEALASHALNKAFKRLAAAGQDLAELDAVALHDVRKRIKKLRYATEFFAPLFAVKQVRRFVEKLVDLQQSLGGLNDAVVAAELMQRLAGGVDRAWATGAMQGYLAGTSDGAARHCGKAWQKLLAQERFWS
jgi:CHAD domain-containing protein